MKIKDIKFSRAWDGSPVLEITLNKAEIKAVEQLLQVDKADIPNYELTIEKRRKKRSLDANSYCWVLCKKLADILHSTDVEIYQQMIIDYGVWEIVPVKAEKVEEKINFYKRQGLGDDAIDMGECKALEGYHNVKRYYGSSRYDTKQMTRFIDGIIYECNEVGVETLPPEEVKRLKEMWK